MEPIETAETGVLRIIDAASNRAREGLRVLEDITRFVCDDADLTERLKALRHRLRDGLDTLPGRASDRLDARDTPGDVGTSISTQGEHDRSAGTRDVAAAACKRVQEALRSLEEHAKAFGAGPAFESSRYAMYDIERSLMSLIAPPCPQWTVCVLVTRALCLHHRPEDVIRLAAAGGAGCVQLREKSMEGGELLDHAGRIAEVCRETGVHLIINDRPDIARLVDADGVHVGQGDLPVRAARAIVGSGRWVGVSCSTIGHAEAAATDGADVCGLGPMFPSTTKVKPTLAGTELVRAYVGNPCLNALPHLAISGITADNIGVIADAGGRGVAVSSSVCGAEDPSAVCRALVEELTRERNAPATIDA